MPKPKKVVLAYSGGLDTSIIIPWLKENYGCEVIAVIGRRRPAGRPGSRAQESARHGCFFRARRRSARRICARLHLADASRRRDLRNTRTCSGTSMARPVIAKRQAEIALKLGADGLSHGCTARAMTRCDSNWRTKPSRQTCKLLHRGENGILIRAKTPSPTRRSTMFPSSRARRTFTAATATSGTSATKAASSRILQTRRTKRCGSGSFLRRKLRTSRRGRNRI